MVVTRAAGSITAHQVGEVKFDLDVIALKQQLRLDAGLPALSPGRHGVHDELQTLLLDVGEGRSIKISNHVRWHTKESGHVGDLKLAQFQKLGVFVCDAHFVKLHAVFQHQDLAPVGAGLRLLIRLTKHLLGLGVLERARKFNPPSCGLGVIGKETCAIALGC